MPTPTEIAEEIGQLKALRGQIEHDTPNYHALTAQIVALQIGMTHDQAHDRWPAETELETLSGALEAIRWREGKSESAPSADWEELVAGE
jgi:hypothetical protein